MDGLPAGSAFENGMWTAEFTAFCGSGGLTFNALAVFDEQSGDSNTHAYSGLY